MLLDRGWRVDSLHFGNQGYIIELYRTFRSGEEIDPAWKAFFLGFEMKCLLEAPPPPSLDIHEPLKRHGRLTGSRNPIVPKGEAQTGQEGPFERADHNIGPIGFEYMHIRDETARRNIEEILEEDIDFSPEEKRRFLLSLMEAKGLEEFLQAKFLGAKRFSVEGGEVLLPMLFELEKVAAEGGVEEISIGMAHRGRLVVLCQVLGKPYNELFAEFEGKDPPHSDHFTGDVKYHKGRRHDADVDGKKLRLSLLSNPSHLEGVVPVVLGYTRAQMDTGRRIMPLLIHGDASVAGQGVIYEALQMHKLAGYGVGGALHVIINNRIGFTASPEETRSSRYPSDIAKAFDMPVFHVDGEDVEACIRTMRYAFKILCRLGLDVFIDLNCYRLYGHNEADEPRFTNPLLYEEIRSRKSVFELYRTALQANIATEENRFQEKLKTAFEKRHEAPLPTYHRAEEIIPKTAISREQFFEFLEKTHTLDPEFHTHPRIDKLFKTRLATIREKEGGKGVDWGAGELITYASLIHDGFPVRLSGQDSKRGTFSHRHSVIIDQKTETEHVPLAGSIEPKGNFFAYNSLLSEYAVMGFEFGYAGGRPGALVIWEGQFGDFANGGQVVIDQFLSSSETKWGAPNHLVLYLPHGMEGMGPEHSSCRLERFLQLSSGRNWNIIQPTMPAQLFHALRRQMMRSVKLPLIVLMPKSMLRLPDSYSTTKEFTDSLFHKVISDAGSDDMCIFCSGKIYYALCQKKKELGKDTTIVRIEEIYPFPQEEIAPYVDRKILIWVQEEHKNQGAWHYMQEKFKEAFREKGELVYRGREASSATASGFAKSFEREQENIVMSVWQNKT